MRVFVFVAATLSAALAAAAVAWRRDQRIGSAFVNRVVNPWLLQRGLAGGKHSEIGPLEHFGRRSGIRRLAPLHPEPTPEGFRFMVPLGARSEWARNVMAAGCCRLQLHEQVYELVDPQYMSVSEVHDLPMVARTVMSWLGFGYLSLRTAEVRPGSLEP